MDREGFLDKHLWLKYHENPTKEARELLINNYKEFANKLAGRMYKNRQIPEIEFDEFRQYALMGLIESIDRYRPSSGASFETFAGYRINGAILNGIEKYNEKQQQITFLSQVRRERIESILKSAAASDDPFLQLVDVALGLAVGVMLNDSRIYLSGGEVAEQNVYHSVETKNLVETVAKLIPTLTESEQEVITQHYFHHLLFEEVSMKMKISKGRVSQLHASALKKLKDNCNGLTIDKKIY